MLALIGVNLQALADHLLAPAVTFGAIVGTSAIAHALVAAYDAERDGLDAAATDAQIQSRYNRGLVKAGWVAIFPVGLLVIEALK
jgi:hypothetical protein